MSSSSAGGHEMTGRVVRLHFRCHAALPIGSFLRVTGSTLWAPGTAAHDPTDASPAMERTQANSFPTSTEDSDLSDGVIPVSALYTSSVEMVTTPEEYPVWRTRKPVVVVWHHSHKQVQHHYYRYLVVSPGGGISEFHAAGGSNETEMETDMDDYPTMVSTSNEGTGQTVVMQWEDPFHSLLTPDGKESTMKSSAVSLTSSLAGGVVTKANYRNLPYRTIDIDARSFNAEASKVKLDRWNMPDDMTFRPYLIRDAVR
jgi:hypothetical protein